MICKGFGVKEATLSDLFRRLAFVVFNTNVDKKHQVKDPSALWEIPELDPKPKTKQESEEEQRENFRRFKDATEYFKRVDAKKKRKNG
jgi:hypothetical protein